MTGKSTNQWNVGLVGYGEVGRILAEDLRKQDVRVAAYDLKLDNNQATASRDHASDNGVFGPKSAEGFARNADWRIEADRILAGINDGKSRN